MKKGDVFNCKVKKIFKTHIKVELPNKKMALLHISEVSDYFVSSFDYFFDINQKYEMKIIEIDKEQKNIKMSWKVLNPRFLKNPFSFEIGETKNGIKNLHKLIEKEEKND